jgi:uncharacterized membrane protein
LTWVRRTSWPRDPQGTKRLAEEESQSRSTDTAVLIAAVASLGAVAEALVRSSSNQDSVAITLVILSILAASRPPTSTSPTWPSWSAWPTRWRRSSFSTRIRKVVLGHSLLSYAFGTGILAVAINLVTNLGQ